MGMLRRHRSVAFLDLCLDGNCAVVWFADSQENAKSISSDHVGEACRYENQHRRGNGGDNSSCQLPLFPQWDLCVESQVGNVWHPRIEAEYTEERSQCVGLARDTGGEAVCNYSTVAESADGGSAV